VWGQVAELTVGFLAWYDGTGDDSCVFGDWYPLILKDKNIKMLLIERKINL
jgi:dTDP-4-dehydrorhamnose 3,5-epimerase-like enzyme